MDNNQIFEGIPALNDQQGLDALLNQQAMSSLGLDPNAAQPETAPAQAQDPNAPAQTQPAQQPAAPAAAQQPVYTSEQVAQIINAMRVQQAQPQQAPQAQPRTPAQPAGGYSQQQINAINTLLARGVPIDRIAAYMNGQQNPQQNSAQQQILNRVQQLEQYLQEQQYTAERNAFIDKMNTFGDKFGLSEDDLVTFGNKALSMGINLTEVSDVEAVFRAVYPEQYAIRSQRIAGSNSSQIYGGASLPTTPQAQASKLEDAYVDAFMKQTMPNQYQALHPNKS